MKFFLYLIIAVTLTLLPRSAEAQVAPGQVFHDRSGQATHVADDAGKLYELAGGPFGYHAGQYVVDEAGVRHPITPGQSLRNFAGRPLVDHRDTMIGVADADGRPRAVHLPLSPQPSPAPATTPQSDGARPRSEITEEQPSRRAAPDAPTSSIGTVAGQVPRGHAVFVPERHGPDRLRYQPRARGGGFGSALMGGLVGGAAVLGAAHYATLGAAAAAVATAPFYQVALVGAPLGYLAYQGVAQFTRRAADRHEVDRMNGAIVERYNAAVAHHNVMTAMGHDAAFDQEAALHAARADETRIEHRRVGPFGWFRSKWTQVVDGNGNVLGTTDRAPHWWEFRERSRMRKGVAGAQRLPVHLTRTPNGSSAASFRPAVPASR